jgi:hypothetical protein
MERCFLSETFQQLSSGENNVSVTWDRCHDLKNIFAEIFGVNIGGFAQTSASF